MNASKPIYAPTLLLIAGLLLAVAPVRAETSLIEVLQEKKNWVGKVDWISEGGGTREKRLKVTFQVEGKPPEVSLISHIYGDEFKRNAHDFKLEGVRVKFWIDPKNYSKSRNRVYDLELINGTLKGTLTGLKRDLSEKFPTHYVLLRPAKKSSSTECPLCGLKMDNPDSAAGLDIETTAKKLIEEFGEYATLEAFDKAVNSEGVGDFESKATWLKIKARVEALQKP